MEQEEWESDVTECAACGVDISVGTDPVYAFGQQEALCFECAIARGGQYDADEDRWLVSPRTGDLEKAAPDS